MFSGTETPGTETPEFTAQPVSDDGGSTGIPLTASTYSPSVADAGSDDSAADGDSDGSVDYRTGMAVLALPLIMAVALISRYMRR